MTSAAAPLDALVVGAGPAGLTGALYLARFRRSVLVVDAGGGRAVRIPRSHNVPGHPGGIAGAELVAAMRRQAAEHGVRFAAARIERLARGGDGGFEVAWPDGGARARSVLLATGVSDVEPAMPQLAAALDEGALRYCPVCDGYEVIDQAVGLLADSGSDLHEALYLRHFTPRLTVFVAGPAVRFDAAQRERLRAAGIALVEQPVRAIRRAGGGVRIEHGDAATHCDSLYSALGIRVHSELAVALGARHGDDGYLLTDRHQQTSIDGLYAAGDVSRGLNQISVAMGDAAVAAAAMHRGLDAAPTPR